MSTFSLKFQTSENIPPPFAHAIELSGAIEQNKELDLSFELSYLDRELLSEEEILDEGFSMNDDFKWQGSLPAVWKDIIYGNLKSAKPLKIKDLEPHQHFWQIDFEGQTFYPANADKLSYLLEEIQQAVFEKAGRELPLNLVFYKSQAGETKEIAIHASFVERTVEIRRTENNLPEKTTYLPWEELNFILKNTFSGEFIIDLAFNKKPSHKGTFVNIGDGYWYEVGKSMLIEPHKIKKIFKL
ncbi:hypothetical protein [Emticicia sp. 21SJ11W-3]|uniref:hypothetical protein n=1 Tax=Emticicia sp. 21SJ11W-3 TaxID=2916755 RepID=UPI0020A09F44|nr:hypothetical protein [Emticicia sp. 21SJ11W-3]UTA70246.1 hypothetical protein MB380_10565 [Emticicia sp. 21SJ11W-3]